MDSLIFELQIVFYFQLFLSANVRHSMEGRGKRDGDCHAGYIDCSNRLKVLALSRCRARLQQKSFFTRDAQ